MNRKQKKILFRIIISFVLTAVMAVAVNSLELSLSVSFFLFAVIGPLLTMFLTIDIPHLTAIFSNKAFKTATYNSVVYSGISAVLSIILGGTAAWCLTRSKVKFKTVRQLLQFIGTDLIRKYNTNWHVNRIRKMIDKNKNYVFDDVRFKNELNLVKELGGECWFIIRPIINNVSNHESETSLTWRDFGNKIIINNSHSLKIMMIH